MTATATSVTNSNGSSSSAHVVGRTTSSPAVAALDRLLALPSSELQTMYERASVPRLLDVGGDLRGRMLAWPAFDRRPGVANAVRAFASIKHFPWRGKSFTPGESRGEGINRVFSDRLRLFRFETFIGKSRAGDFDALQLDYDLPENPGIIRAIKDEIREVEPGLWLGQAYFATKKSETLVLYFGLAHPSA
jgi:hypothetical protein